LLDVFDALRWSHRPDHCQEVPDRDRAARDELTPLPSGRMRPQESYEHGWVSLSGSAHAAAYEMVEQALECVPGVWGITSEVLT
jgi:hypothetical protein